MATLVCRRLLSSFVDSPQMAVPPLMPPTQVTLRLKLAPPQPADLGGWSFLQSSLSSTNNSTEEWLTPVRGKDAYAPPPVRQSSVKLSDRSLQLCTENLGSETGADTSEGESIFTDVNNPEFERKPPTAMTTGGPSRGKKVNPPREIPPPLTTLRGAETLQVRAHREQGRLVINAVKSTPRRPCFLAERVDGRLRLSLLAAKTDTLHSCDHEGTYELQKSELRAEDQNQPIRIHTKASHREVEKDIENQSGVGEHLPMITESSLLGEGEPGEHDRGFTTETLIQRPIISIRCKEGDHDHHHHHHRQNNMLNREPLWVATS